MMKKILILILFFTLIASLSISTAIEDSANFKQLEKDVSSGDIIVLNKNYTNLDNYSADGVNISRNNIVIKGEADKNITIDAKSIGRIFNANKSQNITFENINFKNGNCSQAGGAVYLDEINSNNVINCTFINCTSQTFGGAMTGNAINSTFTYCSSIYHGGAIFEGSSINCTFIDCFSTGCGGAVSSDNEAMNSSFIDCYSYWRGGALYKTDAFACNFEDCFSSEGGAMFEGSAFACDFLNCGARNGSGGAIYDGSATGCSFAGCYVNNGQGSAMYKGTSSDCRYNANESYDVVNTPRVWDYNQEDMRIFHLFK